MPVPYIFANVPGGSTIPLFEIDANFAYLSYSPTLQNLTVLGALSVSESFTSNGTATFKDGFSSIGPITINGSTVNPVGTTGSDYLVFNTNPVFVNPNLGKPSYGDLVNCTNFLVNNLTGCPQSTIQFLKSPSSVNLISAVTDSTGIGKLVFNTSPTLVSPNLITASLGLPSSGNLKNCTGYLSTNIDGIISVSGGGTGLSNTGSINQVLTVISPNVLGYRSLPTSYLNLMQSQNAAGASVVFGPVPDWVNRITVYFYNVTTTGGASPQIQVQNQSGAVTSGYTSSCRNMVTGPETSTTGFSSSYPSSGGTFNLTWVISKVDKSSGVNCICQIQGTVNNDNHQVGTGSLYIPQDITGIICSFNGASNYTGGKINVLYE